MRICKKFLSIEKLLQTKLTNRKYLKNDYLMNVFSKKSLLKKWKIAKNFHRSKDFCKQSWHVEKLLQTKFINTKFLAKKLLINEIIKTNTRTMNNEAINKKLLIETTKNRSTNKQTKLFFEKQTKKTFSNNKTQTKVDKNWTILMMSSLQSMMQWRNWWWQMLLSKC